MAKVSLSISGVKEGMSSVEVQQSLAQLYGKPETHFEKVSQSLFIMRQPHVLLKDVDQDVAAEHEKRLSALGFQCDLGDGGLTLAPSAATGTAAVCPACQKECGDEDTCQHCGVLMQKYARQQKIDEQLQKQLQSASSSHERINKFQAKQAQKSKELAKAKRKAKQEKKRPANADKAQSTDTGAIDNDDDLSDFKAQIKEKRNYVLHGALAATLLVVGGGGFIAYDHISNRYISDAPVQMAATTASSTTQSQATATTAASSNGAPIAIAAKKVVEENQPTVFDQWTDRKRELLHLKTQLAELIEEDMPSSASGLVAGKTNPTEQVYGRQELIKLEGDVETTDRKLLSAYMLVLSLESEADRVAATLNQSSIYHAFSRHDDATKTYDQAAKIALTVEDPQQRILSETAIAEHHVDYGNLEGARARYQAAKDRVGELNLTPDLKTAALNYIAASEAAKGLTGDAEKTAEQISDSAGRQKTLANIASIAKQNKTNGVPELAAGRDSKKENGTGDQMIDDLIEMNEQNKKKLKAASSLLGQ